MAEYAELHRDSAALACRVAATIPGVMKEVEGYCAQRRLENGFKVLVELDLGMYYVGCSV